MRELDSLQQILGFSFKDVSLLRQALTHPSYANEDPQGQFRSNERLEYLGDTLLGFIVGWELYERFPALSEGELTKLRASLVCRENLARLANKFDLGNYIFLGKGEEKCGGRQKLKILASCLEAIIGAAFVDQGFEAARKLVRGILGEDLGEVVERKVEDPCLDYRSSFRPSSDFPPYL
ncbi:MAG: ribonuclease III family protein [Anaerolineae bacterium]|nr:ribonuclease III family protein [Anaerolineae bacterium]